MNNRFENKVALRWLPVQVLELGVRLTALFLSII